MHEAIKQGFMVFVSDGETGIGSVRQVAPAGRRGTGDLCRECRRFRRAVRRDRGGPCRQGHPEPRAHHARSADGDRPCARCRGPDFVADSPAGDDSDTFSSDFIEQQRERLLALRAQLLGSELAGSASARDYQEQHGEEAQEFEERAQEMAQNEIRQALHDVDLRRLSNINRALRKIEEGTYGRSDVSGQRIPLARLAIAPEALLTVEEEQAREKIIK